MTGFVRAHVAAFVLILSAVIWPVPDASADVFVYDGEIFFCTTTCDSFGALGGATGGSGNTVNSVVVGSIDLPVQGDGSFSFGPGAGTAFSFTITTSAIPLADPIIGPAATCPPPNQAGQLCNPTTVNPLPLSPSVATVEGSGMVAPDGTLMSGMLIFTFTVAPFSNNLAVVTFDLSDSSAEGTVFGVVPFTRIQGAFVPAPSELTVSMPVPDPFPDTAVGETSTAQVTVTNAGLGEAVITLGTGSLAAPFSISAETCTAGPVPVTVGSCTIDIEFAPTAEGAAMASFTIDALANDPPSITVNLVGNAIVPEISVAPNPLVFTDTAIGTSQTLDVTVSNDGVAPLVIPAGGVTALAAPYNIAADGCSGTSVAASGSCVVSVTFTPTAEGAAAAASFDISSNDPNEPIVTVDVTGAGAAPDITVAPLTLSFPSILTGQAQTRDITITNDGSADLIVGMIDGTTVVAPFALVADGCSMMTLAATESCTLMIEFSPTIEGVFTNDLAIPSNDTDEAVVTAMLEGTATAAAEAFITLDPTALGLGDVIVSQMNMAVVTVINDGSADLIVSGVTIAGANAAEFGQTTQCATVAPNAQCEIMVSFTPADVGERSATLSVASNAANTASIDIELTGMGVAGPQLTLSVQTLAVGSTQEPVELDESAMASFMIVSSGSTDVTIASIALSGDGSAEFSISDEDCTEAALPSMQPCNVEVTFAPLTAGDKTVTITVTSNDVDEPEQTIALTGFVLTGSRPEVSVPELVIGTSTAPVTVGESSESEIAITNTGTDPLMVVSVVLAGIDAADFSLMEDCSATPVDRSQTCTIAVTFAPTSPGEKTAEVQITTDNVVTRQQTRGTSQQVTIVPIMASAAAAPPPPPAPAGSQTTTPPAFATADEDSGGACFIATAAYGSYLDPNVQVLRDFRDDVLLKTWAGRKFVRLYYANSPLLADYIARHEGARTVTRLALTPVIYAVAYPVPAALLILAMWAFMRRRRQRVRALAS